MSQTLRMLLFVSTLTLVLSGLAFHVYRRVTRSFGLAPGVRRAFSGFLVLGIASGVLGRTLDDRAPSVAAALGAFGGLVTLGVLITSVLLWPYELSAATALLTRWWRRRRASEPRAPGPEVPARRDFLAQVSVGGAATLGLGASSYGTFVGRHDYELETVPLAVPKLPRALDGFTVVQLSDIHVGLYVGERELSAGLDLVRKAKPDIVVLTGDLVDHDPAYAPVLGRFVHALRGVARRGVFAIPGNHDYYAGAPQVLRALREAGAEVLVNRHLRVGDPGHQFVLAGVDDVMAARYGGKGPSLAQAFEDAPRDLARVLLSHNPSFFKEAHAHADLTLSGHTHGGQVTLFINPAELVLDHGLVRGHYLRHQSQIYVNRGFGTAGPPARVGSPPEVSRLILTTT